MSLKITRRERRKNIIFGGGGGGIVFGPKYRPLFQYRICKPEIFLVYEIFSISKICLNKKILIWNFLKS